MLPIYVHGTTLYSVYIKITQAFQQAPTTVKSFATIHYCQLNHSLLSIKPFTIVN